MSRSSRSIVAAHYSQIRTRDGGKLHDLAADHDVFVKTGCIYTNISTIRYGKRRSTIINPRCAHNTIRPALAPEGSPTFIGWVWARGVALRRGLQGGLEPDRVRQLGRAAGVALVGLDLEEVLGARDGRPGELHLALHGRVDRVDARDPGIRAYKYSQHISRRRRAGTSIFRVTVALGSPTQARYVL